MKQFNDFAEIINKLDSTKEEEFHKRLNLENKASEAFKEIDLNALNCIFSKLIVFSGPNQRKGIEIRHCFTYNGVLVDALTTSYEMKEHFESYQEIYLEYLNYSDILSLAKSSPQRTREDTFMNHLVTEDTGYFINKIAYDEKDLIEFYKENNKIAVDILINNYKDTLFSQADIISLSKEIDNKTNIYFSYLDSPNKNIKSLTEFNYNLANIENVDTFLNNYTKEQKTVFLQKHLEKETTTNKKKVKI